MAGLDKEETISFVEAGRQIFLRFGSTRGFNQFLFLLFLYGIVRLDPTMAPYAIVLGAATTALVLLSFHKKPHIDERPKSAQA